MKTVLLVSALLVLAACGVDGPPEDVPGGVSLSGSAKIGVRGSL